MAHFAQIDNNNKVTQVIVIDDNLVNTAQDFINNILNLPGKWLQTSYNTSAGIHYDINGKPDNKVALRYNFAGINFNYDPIGDAFYTNSPYPSWILDKTTYTWKAPKDMPNVIAGYKWVWDEKITDWVSIKNIDSRSTAKNTSNTTQ